MEELEQNLENLDELRRQAKDYASTLVLPNDERLNPEDRKIDEHRQAELLQKRDEQEAKLIEEMKITEETKDKPLFVPTSERYYKTESQKHKESQMEDEIQARKVELERIKAEQEARWKMQTQNSLIGKISKKVKIKLVGNHSRIQSLLESDFLEEVAQVAEDADSRLSEIVPIEGIEKVSDSANFSQTQIPYLEQNTLLVNVPTSTLEQIKDEELLFSIEKEEIKPRTLKQNNNGSVFSSILIMLTTLTIGMIAAVMILK